MTDAYAPSIDPVQEALSRLVSAASEECIFGLAAALGNSNDALEDLVKRRKDAHQLVVTAQNTPRMLDAFDAWVVEMARAMAPICPPSWMPMAEVLAREGHARGRRARPSLALLVQAERQGRPAREAPRLARGARAARGARVRRAARRRGGAHHRRAHRVARPPGRGRSAALRRGARRRSSASTSTARSTAPSRARCSAARGSPRRGTASTRARSTSSACSRPSSAHPSIDVEVHAQRRHRPRRRAANRGPRGGRRHPLRPRRSHAPGYGVQLAALRRHAHAPAALPRRGAAPSRARRARRARASATRGSAAPRRRACSASRGRRRSCEDPTSRAWRALRARHDRVAAGSRRADAKDARRPVDDMLTMSLAEPSTALVP